MNLEAIERRVRAAPDLESRTRLAGELIACGVDVCFASPGTSEMHFVAALDAEKDMRAVLGLFEIEAVL